MTIRSRRAVNPGVWLSLALFTMISSLALAAGEIPRDAEYYVLEAQHGEQWREDDKALDEQLAAFREKNGGKPPNIFYILIDDIGFGDLGDDSLNSIRGYKTPAINEFAREGKRLSRMYTEPSCTPTRVAFMTGRHPFRNGMGNTAVDISGFGLAANEVTIAEALSEAGYNTSHVGKWHMGDIKEAWPNFQGFDYAAFPIHQQGQLTIFHDDAADEEVSIGIGDNNYDDLYTLDGWLRTDAASMVMRTGYSRCIYVGCSHKTRGGQKRSPPRRVVCSSTIRRTVSMAPPSRRSST